MGFAVYHAIALGPCFGVNDIVIGKNSHILHTDKRADDFERTEIYDYGDLDYRCLQGGHSKLMELGDRPQIKLIDYEVLQVQ